MTSGGIEEAEAKTPSSDALGGDPGDKGESAGNSAGVLASSQDSATGGEQTSERSAPDSTASADPSSGGAPAGAPEEESADERETTAKLSIQELTAGWKDKEQQKPTVNTVIRFGAKTNLGRVRENNEDKFDFFVPDQGHILAERGCLYAVADGMGGHAAGQIASEYALNVTIRAFYSDTESETADALRGAVQQANQLINEAANALPERNQMGTTLTCAVIREDDLFIGHVGDSRAYLYRDEELRQITEDHSWVAEQVKRGAMTPEEAETSPFRNYITRSLGTMPDVDVDLYQEKLQEGDVILLCSDGLCGLISDAEIAETLSKRSPSLATLMLVEKANEAGGRDNITAVVLQIACIEPFEKKKTFPWARNSKPARR